MNPRKSPPIAALMLLASGLIACSDSGTDPDSGRPFDAATMQAGVASMERIASTPAIESFKLLGRLVSPIGADDGVEPGAPLPGGSAAARLAAMVRRIAGLVGPTTEAQLVPILRSSVLGSTFVYDPAGGRYVVDPARTGAPGNGVRFILYEVDPETHDPRPEAEIGYADLIDEKAASGSALGLRLRVVAHGITHLEYGFELSGLAVSPTLAVNGFLSDGTDRLNFNLRVTGQLIGQAGEVRLDAELEIPSHDFKVAASVEGRVGEVSGDGRVDLTVRAGADVIAVQVQVEDQMLEATFRVNGQLLATAEGDPEHPVIKGEGGRDLTPEEMAALVRIVGLAEAVFHLFYELLEPIGVLVGVGVNL
ncbi:MAG TPA: hypothetical protein VGA78_09030 [Gemmatimonadales bacterium]